MPHVAQAMALCSLAHMALERWHATGRDPLEAGVLVRAFRDAIPGPNPAEGAEAQMRAAFDGAAIAIGDAEDAVGRMRDHFPVMARALPER
jgi:hypothetical protein